MKRVTESFPLPWLAKRESPCIPGDWLGAGRAVPEKKVFPPLATACVCIWAAPGMECLPRHHLVRSLPRWVHQKSNCLRKLRTQLQLCCFYAVLELAWLLFLWGGRDARTVSAPFFGQAEREVMAPQVRGLAETKDPECLKLNSQPRQLSTHFSSCAGSQRCFQNMSKPGVKTYNMKYCQQLGHSAGLSRFKSLHQNK